LLLGLRRSSSSVCGRGDLDMIGLYSLGRPPV
jgi:hypothetical protein